MVILKDFTKLLRTNKTHKYKNPYYTSHSIPVGFIPVFPQLKNNLDID